jgi:hypothetical protein
MKARRISQGIASLALLALLIVRMSDAIHGDARDLVLQILEVVALVGFGYTLYLLSAD